MLFTEEEMEKLFLFPSKEQSLRKKIKEEERKKEEEKQRIVEEKRKLFHLNEINKLIGFLAQNQDIDGIYLDELEFERKKYSIKINSKIENESVDSYTSSGEIFITCSDGRTLSINTGIETDEYEEGEWTTITIIEHKDNIKVSYSNGTNSLVLQCGSYLDGLYNALINKITQIQKMENDVYHSYYTLSYGDDELEARYSFDFDQVSCKADNQDFYIFYFNQDKVSELSHRPKFIQHRYKLSEDESSIISLDGNNLTEEEQRRNYLKLVCDKEDIEGHIKKDSIHEYTRDLLYKLLKDINEKIEDEKETLDLYSIAYYPILKKVKELRDSLISKEVENCMFSEKELLFAVEVVKKVLDEIEFEKNQNEIEIDDFLQGLSKNQVKLLRKKLSH